MEKRLKTKYRGVFNFKNETHFFYKSAFSEKQAWLHCCRSLAKKHGVPAAMVIDRFDFDSKKDFEITEESSE